MRQKYVNVRLRQKTYDFIKKKKRGRYVMDVIEDAVNNYFA